MDYTFMDQEVVGHAILPDHIDNPDVWVASKVNSTRKDRTPTQIYHDIMDREDRDTFVRRVRDMSVNRLHLGAFVVQSMEFEIMTSSMVSLAFTQGKFYKMQQQTRRSVILDTFCNAPDFYYDSTIQYNHDRRFSLYKEVTDKRRDEVKGFDHYIQDIFKVLPFNVMTRFVANLDLRTIKEYTRWRDMEYLPSSIRQFSQKLHDQAMENYPIMFDSSVESFLPINAPNKQDVMQESSVWYSDHPLFLPENTYFNTFYERYNLSDLQSGEAKIIDFNNMVDIDDILSFLDEPTEQVKSLLELGNITVATINDPSGAIDTFRHTQNRRMNQPIYHALENNPQVLLPELYRRQKENGNHEIPDRMIDLTEESVEIYHELVDHGIPRKEAINILPHNIGLIQIETMDMFSLMNVLGLRTCIHARPDVQNWAYAIISALDDISQFNGIAEILPDGSLPRAKQMGYCPESTTCNRCGDDIVQLPLAM